jgi:hypothetical protein
MARSCSDHDTEECIVAGTAPSDPDDGFPIAEMRLHLPQCPVGSGSRGNAAPVIPVCLWCFGVMAFFFALHKAQ